MVREELRQSGNICLIENRINVLFSISVCYLPLSRTSGWSEGSFFYQTASPAYWVLDAQT